MSFPVHDSLNPAPWEEKFLPKGAKGVVTIRVFVYPDEEEYDAVNERIMAAGNHVWDARGDLFTELPYGVRAEIDDGTERTKYEWFYEPVQE